MNLRTVLRLMLKPDLWMPAPDRLFPDELFLKDGDLRFFADESVCFRRRTSGEVVYEVPLLAWPLVNILAGWLKRRVMRKAGAG